MRFGAIWRDLVRFGADERSGTGREETPAPLTALKGVTTLQIPFYRAIIEVKGVTNGVTSRYARGYRPIELASLMPKVSGLKPERLLG